MSKFFEQYADITALLITFLLPAVLTAAVKLKPAKRVRILPAYLLLFGPAGILTFISFHLLENCYRAIIASINHSFVYTFHFYSLIFMGIVVAVTAYIFLKRCFDICSRQARQYKPVLYAILYIFVICAPQLPLTPISAVPLICCGFSLTGLCLVYVFEKRDAMKMPALK